MKKLLIVGIGCVSLKYLSRALEPLGYTAVLLARRTNFSAQVQDYLEDIEIHEIDTCPVSDVCAYVRTHPAAFNGITAVTSLFDEQFPLVETLAAEFGWASPGPIPAWLSHKNAVLSLVPEFSPPSVCFAAPDLDRMPLRQTHRWGPHLLLKPVRSSGGAGVCRLQTGTGLRRAMTAHVSASGLPSSAGWVLQKDISGRLLSFEGFVEAGWVRRLGVSSRSRIGFTEVASRYPAEDDLSQTIISRGWDCIDALVSRARYQYGYFHCEFIQTPTTVHLVDANIGRIGGATVLEQVALAHSIDPHQLLAHVLLLPVLRGRCPFSLCMGARLAPVKTLGIWYGMPESARLKHLSVADIRGRHTQFASDGEEIPRVGESDYGWVGLLSGLEDDVLSDIQSITVRTDEGDFEPAFALD
jgi:hypothetical protein